MKKRLISLMLCGIMVANSSGIVYASETVDASDVYETVQTDSETVLDAVSETEESENLDENSQTADIEEQETEKTSGQENRETDPEAEETTLEGEDTISEGAAVDIQPEEAASVPEQESGGLGEDREKEEQSGLGNAEGKEQSDSEKDEEEESADSETEKTDDEQSPGSEEITKEEPEEAPKEAPDEQIEEPEEILDERIEEPVEAEEAEESIQSGMCGTNLSWTLDGETLTISGTGAMTDYTSGKAPWYLDLQETEEKIQLVLEDGITSIGNYAFYNCSSLVGELTIPDSVTNIGDSAFSNCTGLTGLKLSENMTILDRYIFSGCSGISGEVVIPDKVTTICYDAFYNCSRIESFVFGSGLTQMNKDASYYGTAFKNCSGVKTLTFLSETPPNIGNMTYHPFVNMTNLETVYVPSGCYGAYNKAYRQYLPEKTKVRETGTDTEFLISETGELTGYQGAGGEVVIPEEVTSIGAQAFAKNMEITGIVLHDGITSIGDYAFDGSGLTGEVVIPDSVESVGAYAFRNCHSMTGIALGKNVKTLERYVFYGCENLEQVSLVRNLPEIKEYSFYGCKKLTSVGTLLDGVTGIGNYAFYNCSGLTGNLMIPDSVTSIGEYAFYNCSGLTGELTISDSVTSIGNYAFSNCTGLTGLKLSENMTILNRNIFSGCSGISGEVVIPDKVTTIRYNAFYNCSRIESFLLGSGLTQMNEGADYYGAAFRNCSGVKTLTFLSETPPNIGNTTYHPFVNMTSLETVYVPSGCYGAYNKAYRQYLPEKAKVRETGTDTEFLISETGELTGYQGAGGEVVIPEEVTSIGAQVFAKNTEITGIVLHDGITSIGNYAFDGSGLTGEVVIPDSVESVGAYAFRNCHSMAGITLGNVKTLGGYAFYGCENLEWVSLGENLTEIKESSFYGCKKLTSVGELLDGVTGIGHYAFYNCSGLTGNLTIPDSVTNIGDYAFYNCSGLTGELTIPDSVTSIGNYAFSNCAGLTGLKLSENMTVLNRNVFSGCSGISGEVVIPDKVTTIRYNAFYNCSRIESFLLGSGLTQMNEGADYYGAAFRNCSGVKTLTFLSETPPNIGNTTYHPFVNMTSLETVYVPSGCYGAYNKAYRQYLPEKAKIRETGTDTEFLISETGELTGYQGAGGEVVIPEEVTSIGAQVFAKNTEITGIVLHDGITSIGNYAFDGSGLTGEVVIPDSVESVGAYAFRNCHSMTGITLGNVKTLGSYAFYGCENLEQVGLSRNLPEIKESSFYGCKKLTSVGTLLDGVTGIGNYAFYNCSGLTGNLTIPDSVTSIGDYAFYNCSGLTGNLTISDSVTSIGNYAFSNCAGLTGLKLSENMTVLNRNVFSGCSGISGEVVIPDKVTTIRYNAFYNCSRIESFVFGSGLTQMNDGADYYGTAFKNCSGVKTLTFLSETPPNIGNTTYHPFVNMTSLETVYVPSNCYGAYNKAYRQYLPEKAKIRETGTDTEFLISETGELTGYQGAGGEVVIPEEVTSIGAQAFAKNKEVTGIVLHDGIISIGDYAFDGSGLTGELELPKSVESVGAYAFRNCQSMTGITLGNVKTLGGYAFYGCENLERVSLGENLTEIREFSFYGCRKLISVGELPDRMTSIGNYAFYNCSSLAGELKLPKTVATIGSNVFYNCSGLTGELTIPDSVTSIENYAFSNCTGLTGLKLSENMTILNRNIFYGCSGISGEVVIPDKVTTICYNAFYNCSRIESFVFGSGLTRMNDGADYSGTAFKNCSGVKTLTFLSETPPNIGNTTYHPFVNMKNLETVYIADDSRVSAYESAYAPYMPSGVVFTADVSLSRPNKLTASYISSNRVVLIWNRMNFSQIAGYAVYRDGQEIGRTEEPSWEDTEVESGISYTYEVCGYTDGDTEQMTGKASLTVQPKLSSVLAISTSGCESDTIAGSRTTLYARVSNAGSFGGYKELSCMGSFWYERDGEEVLLGEAKLQSVMESYGTFALKIDITDIPEDYYRVVFRYQDPEGNMAEGEEAIFIRQSGPQKIVGVTTVDDTNRIILNWAISSEASSTKYLIYKKEASEEQFTLLTRINSRSTLSYTDTDVELDCYYDYYVVTVNDYGQYSEPSDIARGCPNKDVQAPIISTLKPENGSVLSQTRTISAAATDNVGVTRIELQQSLDDGETWTTLAQKDASDIQASVDTTELADGSVKIRALAYDAKENVSDGTPVYTYRIDNTGPSQVTGLYWTAADVTATLYWDDVPEEDFYFFRVERLDGEDWVTVSDVYRTKGTNLYGLTPDSSYTYRVAAYDLYLNRGEVSEPVTVQTLSDTTAPVISALSPKSGRYASSIRFTATGNDDYGIAGLQIQYSTDLEEWTTAAEQVFDGVSRTQSLTAEIPLLELPEGSIYLRGVAWDFAGNESETGKSAAYVEFILDRTVPAAPGGLSLETGDGYLNLGWEQGEEEDLDTYQVYRSSDGENYVSMASGFQKLNYIDRDVESGKEYFYKVNVTDKAGNTSVFSSVISAVCTEDTEAPVIHSVSPADGNAFAATLDTLKLGAAVTDNRKISSISFYWKAALEDEYTLIKTVSGIGSGYSVSYAELSLSNIEDGQKIYFKAEAQDEAGNISVPAEYSCVADGKAPSVSGARVVKSDAERSVTVLWNSSCEEDLAGYYVYRETKTKELKMVGSIGAVEGKKEYQYTDYSLTEEAGVYTYKIRALDRLGNQSETQAGTVVMKDFTAPKAVLNCENLMEKGVEYIFDASGSSDNTKIVRYRFDFGDGTVVDSSKTELIHVYKNAGTYRAVLTVEDEDGNTGTAVHEITVRERSTLGSICITVKDDSGQTVKNAPVYFDLGSESQFIRYSDDMGKVTVTAGIGKHTVGCFKDGYLPSKKDVMLLSGETVETTLEITKQELVTGEFEIKRMTLEEIIAAGIDISAPENQYVAEVTVRVTYGSEEVTKKFQYNENGTVFNNDPITVPTSTGTRVWIPQVIIPGGTGAGSGGDSALEDASVAFLDIPVGVFTTKEFFDVKLHIMNNASSDFTLKDNTVTLNIPEGLSIVKANTTLTRATAYVDEIKGQSTETLEWILRGDEIGSYNLSADYSGILEPFERQVTAHFQADESIEVYGLSGCRLTITVPEYLDLEGTMHYTLKFMNEGTIDIYCPQIRTPEDSSVLSMYYASMEESGLIEELPDTLHPGEYVEISCIAKSEYPCYELYDWFVEMYGGYGLQVEIQVQGEEYEDTSIVFTEKDTGYLLKNKELVINGISASTDAEGKIYAKGIQEEKLTVSLEGYYDYIVDTEKILGEHGTHKIALKVVDKLKKPYVSSLYYQDSSGKWKDGFSDELTIYQDTEDAQTVYSFRAEADWQGHGNGKFILSQNQEHKVTSEDGLFSELDLAKAFEPDETVYIYVVSEDGTSSVPLKTEIKVKAEKDLLQKLDGTTLKLGSGMEVTVPEDFPVIGGNKLSINLDNSPVYVQVEGDQYKIGFGVDSKSKNDYALAKKYFEKLDECKTESEKYAILRQMSKKYGGFATKELTSDVSFKYGMNGYVEGTMTSSGFVVTEGQIFVYMEFEGGITRQLAYPTVFYSLKLGTKFGAEGTIDRVIPDSSIPFTFDLTISANPYFKATGGVGIKDIIAVELTGGVETNFTWELVNNYQKITGKANVSIKAYTGPFTWIDKELWAGETTFYENNPSASAAKALDYYDSYGKLMKSIYDSGNYVASGTYDYSAGWLAEKETENASSRVLQDHVYPDARQTIVETDDVRMMVWLSQDSSRLAQNSTLVVYSVYDADKGTWSAPKAVCDDGTADLYPQAVVEDNTIYVIWQNTSRILEESENTLEDLSRNAQIRTARYDENKDSFVVMDAMAEEETESGVYSDPVLVSENGTIAAVWTCNSEGDIFGIQGTNRILASKMTPDGWSEPQTLAEGLSVITSWKACVSDGSVRAACSIDMDGDLTTSGDWEIFEYVCSEDGTVSGRQITENEIMDSQPFYGEENGAKVLYWNGGTELKKLALDGSGEILEAGNAAENGCTQVKTQSGTYLFWIGDSESTLGAREIYCAAWDETRENYGNPVCITAEGKYITAFRIVSEKDGSITILYQARTVTGEGESLVLGDSGFYQLSLIPGADLCLSDNGNVTVGNNYPGAAVEFQILAENLGMFPADGYLVQVLDESGKAVVTKTMSTLLEAGGSEEISLPYILPLDFRGQTYTIRAALRAGTEENTENNEFQVRLDGEELFIRSVRTMREGTQAVCILKLENSGALKLEDVAIEIREGTPDGPLLDTVYADDLEAGTTGTFTYVLDMTRISSWKDGTAKIYFKAASGAVSDTGAAVFYYHEENPVKVSLLSAEAGTDGVKTILTVQNEALEKKSLIVMAGLQNKDGTLESYETASVEAEAGRTKTVELLLPYGKLTEGWRILAGLMVPVERVEINMTSAEIKTGDTLALTASVRPSDATDQAVHWSTSNAQIASVSADGQVTAKKTGTAVITCTAADGFGAAAKCSITVTGHTTHIWGDWKTAILPTCTAQGKKIRTCTVEGCDASETSLIAMRGHSYGAYVTTKEATALKEGKKTRTCSVCGASESISIAKLKPVLKLNATSITLQVKQSTTKVKVTEMARGDKVVSWKSGNTKIVKVSNSGKITAQKKTGTATITVKLKSGKSAKIKVKVQKNAVKTTKITGLKKTVTLKKGSKLTLKPVISPITSLEKVSYKSSNTKVASVTSKGVVKGKKAGTAKITVTSGKKKYVVTVKVKK